MNISERNCAQSSTSPPAPSRTRPIKVSIGEAFDIFSCSDVVKNLELSWCQCAAAAAASSPCRLHEGGWGLLLMVTLLMELNMHRLHPEGGRTRLTNDVRCLNQGLSLGDDCLVITVKPFPCFVAFIEVFFSLLGEPVEASCVLYFLRRQWVVLQKKAPLQQLELIVMTSL